MTQETQVESSLLDLGAFQVPSGCRRIFITAELEPSNGDPRIQPTGFPDIGPVLYPDPKRENGLICLIESEASMANWLEEVCLADKYTGELKPALAGLPFIKLTDTGSADGRLITTSTIDGHRFASEYIMNALGHLDRSTTPPSFKSFSSTPKSEKPPADSKTGKRGEAKSKEAKSSKPEFVAFLRDYLDMTGTDKCPAANVPNVFVVAMEHDPLSLIHGFQISVKKKLTFVGLRSPRALTASIVGLDCERIIVPGVRFDPIGTGDAHQAIFQKQRISAGNIQARFSIDVGLLSSLRLHNGQPSHQTARFELLLAIALWKVATFLDQLRIELSLRTECKLRLKCDPKYKAEGSDSREGKFPYEEIAATSFASSEEEPDGRKKEGWITRANFRPGCSPLVLKFEKSKDDEKDDSEK